MKLRRAARMRSGPAAKCASRPRSRPAHSGAKPARSESEDRTVEATTAPVPMSYDAVASGIDMDVTLRSVLIMRLHVLVAAAWLALTILASVATGQTPSTESASATSAPAAADAQPPQPARDAKPAQAAPSPVARWLELQQATFS